MAMLPLPSGAPQGFDEDAWDDLLNYIEERRVIPIIGPDLLRVTTPGGPRPLYLPPEEYFTTVKGQDTVCLAANGEIVPVTDKACPAEVRKALQAKAQ